MRSESKQGTARLKLIVIHGWGGTLAEAVDKIDSLFDFRCRWQDGAFLVPRRTGLVVRQLLGTPEPDRYVIAAQQLIISNMLLASVDPADATTMEASEELLRIDETRLLQEFAHFGLPLAPGARRARALQLRQAALTELDPVLPCVEQLRTRLRDYNGRWAFETEARAIIREFSSEHGLEGDLIQLLETIRDMHETGGDMDTVSSAALYAHGLLASARAQGRELRHGIDYRYVFLNYHESLRGLAVHGAADVLLADLPIGVFDSFAEDARFLTTLGLKIERFEDHHPYTPEQKAMLQKLVDEGLLGCFELSGPLQDQELDNADLRCGADMVHGNTIAGRPWDCSGARSIRHAAHCEDFVTAASELGRIMTALIKGGACKVELAQLLVDSIAGDDALQRLNARTWDQISTETKFYIQSLKPALLENAFVLTFRRPLGSPVETGGVALGTGSDMPAPHPRTGQDDNVRILVALALQPEPGKPRISIGKVIEHFTQSVPDADYLFYCYGARMLVARRLNQADTTFNLGAIMPLLGSAGDGGHGGAAVCRPDANAAYPQRLLGHVRSSNFKNYACYLRHRLAALGYEALAVENRSVPARQQMQRGGKKLLAIVLAAVLLGLLAILLSPDYRRAAILRSNADFFKHIGSERPAQE